MYKFFISILLLLFFTSCEEQEERADAYGNFEATTTTISAEAGGRLLFLQVEEGKPLEAGTLIGLVDTTQLHLQRKQIEASIGTLPKKLKTALEDIKVLENQKSNLIRERDRVQRLVEKKAATSKQLDDLNGEILVLDQRMAAIRSQTQTANRGILAEKEPMLAQIAILDEQIRKSYIYNPIKGRVLTKLAEPSEIVRYGSPLYRIADLDTMTLRVYVGAVPLQDLKIGQEVEVLIDKGVGEYQSLKGTLYWIAEEAEFTPKTIQTKEERVNLVYAVKIRVPNSSGLLKIGMPAEALFTSRPAIHKASTHE